MMKKRYVIFLIVMCFILCGCSNVNDMSLDKIIDKSTGRNVELYNKYRKGYKYNLPMGLMVRKSTDYNETLFDGKYTYYLFVDAVSYYNKVIDTYGVSEEAYVSMPISFEDKYGYLEINNIGDDKYFIEIMYNYAKIEVMVNKANIKTALAYSLSILTSIKYNDKVIESTMGKNVLSVHEESVNIFKTVTSERNTLKYVEDSKYDKDVLPDMDLVN